MLVNNELQNAHWNDHLGTSIMKLRPEQLSQALKKNLLPIYIVSGDETLIVQECCDHIRNTAKAAGFSDREVFQAEAGFDWYTLLESANSISLFAEKKILELRIPNGKPGDKGRKVLQSYAENPAPDTLLLIITGKLESSTPRTKWFSKLENAGAFIQIWPIEPKQLPHWISQRLKRVGLEADREAIQILADRVEGNLLAAAQEIEKLSLLGSGVILNAETITNAVADSSRYNVFNLLDSALAGDAKRTIRMLKGLQGEGSEVIAIASLACREIRQLAQMSSAMQAGENLASIMQRYRVWEKRRPLISAALKRTHINTWPKLLQLALNIDKAIKGIHSMNPWNGLQLLLLQLAGKDIF